MSVTRTGLVTLSQTVSQTARRKFSSAAPQVFKNATAADESKLFKIKTWTGNYELLPVVGVSAFAGTLCAMSLIYALFKEEVNVNNSNRIAPFEMFTKPHRYKLINVHKDKELPPEIQELKKELGPYYRR